MERACSSPGRDLAALPLSPFAVTPVIRLCQDFGGLCIIDINGRYLMYLVVVHVTGLKVLFSNSLLLAIGTIVDGIDILDLSVVAESGARAFEAVLHLSSGSDWSCTSTRGDQSPQELRLPQGISNQKPLCVDSNLEAWSES